MMSDKSVAQSAANEKAADKSKLEKATFGSGCFWCTEAVFDELAGVESAVSGYSGGHVPNPTYEQVCSGRTGHAEVVRVEFDPAEVSYEELLRVFWEGHDPTQGMRQGNDVGTQYRSAIYTFSDEQQAAAEASRAIYEERLKSAGHGAVTTEIRPALEFYEAEEYHQEYFARNPDQGYCRVVIEPKVAKFRQKYFDKLKK